MSQIYKALTSGPVPPAVPDQFTTDVGGPAIPVANNLNLLGRDTIVNDDDGIRTNNDASGSENVYVELTNRLFGSGQTIGAVTSTILTFPFNTNTGPGTYIFTFTTIAYNVTNNLSAYYGTQFGVRFSGGVGTLLPAPDYNTMEEGIMINCDILFGITGQADLTVEVTGLVDDTIEWKTNGIYSYVG